MVRAGGRINRKKEFAIVSLCVFHFNSCSCSSETFQPLYVNSACELKCEILKRCQCWIWNMSITQALPSFIPVCAKYSNISPPLEHVTLTASRPEHFQELSAPIILSYFGHTAKKKEAITRASAAPERQRICGIKQGKRFLLLLPLPPLRERPWRLDRLRGEKMLEGRKKKGTDYVMWGLVYMFPLSSC